MEHAAIGTRQIIAVTKHDIAMAKKMPDKFSGVLAQNLDDFLQIDINGLVAGIKLDCPKVPQELDFPATEQYIEICKKKFRLQMHKNASFYYLKGAEDFRALRAATLALTDLCGKAIIAEITADEDGSMHDNTDCLAAVGVLQKIGVSTVILKADKMEYLEDALERIAPYSRISVGVSVPHKWLKQGVKLTNVEVMMTYDGENAEMLLDELKNYSEWQNIERDHDDYILAPDGRDAHFIDAVTNISDEIECDHLLQERLLQIEDEQAAALKLMLNEEEELYNLENGLYMLTRPVCLCAPTPELIEKALRIYTGLAIYDGTWELSFDVLKYFSEKYGMINL